MKNLSNSIFSPSSCRYWSRIYAWFAWFGLDSHVLPRCFSMQLSPTTWVSQLRREVQNIGFLKLCFSVTEIILKKGLIIKYLYYILAYSIKSAEESFSLSHPIYSWAFVKLKNHGYSDGVCIQGVPIVKITNTLREKDYKLFVLPSITMYWLWSYPS